MNIVFYQTEGRIGGGEMCLLDLLAGLARHQPDWRVTVLLGADGPLKARIDDLGVACEIVPIPEKLAQLGDAGVSGMKAKLKLLVGLAKASFASAGYASLVRSRIVELMPDLVQSNGMKGHILVPLSTPRHIPIVWHLHDYLGSRPLMSRLLRKAAALRRKGSLTGVAVSRSVAADAAKVLGNRAVIETIYNAVDLDLFDPSPLSGAVLDKAAGLDAAPEGTVRVGLVSTFAKWKGHQVFLEAIAQIETSALVRCYIIGGPIYRSTGSQYTLEELRGMAKALGIERRVGFTGHLQNPAAALQALDIVVHASTRPEPFGRVIVEGMACGRAVIVSIPAEDLARQTQEAQPKTSFPSPLEAPSSGAAELFEAEVDAIGVPSGDPRALADAIRKLAADPALRSKLAHNGRSSAQNRFDRDKLADVWVPFYHQIITPSSKPRSKLESMVELEPPKPAETQLRSSTNA